MSQGLLDRDALGGVKGQKLLQQIQGQWVGVRKHGRERDPPLERQRPDIITRPTGFDPVKIFHRRCAQDIEDQVQLRMI